MLKPVPLRNLNPCVQQMCSQVLKLQSQPHFCCVALERFYSLSELFIQLQSKNHHLINMLKNLSGKQRVLKQKLIHKCSQPDYSQ